MTDPAAHVVDRVCQRRKFTVHRLADFCTEITEQRLVRFYLSWACSVESTTGRHVPTSGTGRAALVMISRTE